MKAVIGLLGLCLSPLIQAQTTDLWSVGHGFSQGGLLGVQYQYMQPTDKFTLALGLVGAGIGWQHALDVERNHALGLAAGYEALFAEKGFFGATYTYYPSGFARRGWHFGLFGGMARDTNRIPLFNMGLSEPRNRSRGVAALEIGFQY